MSTSTLLGYRASGEPVWQLRGGDGWSMYAEPDAGGRDDPDDETDPDDDDPDAEYDDETDPDWQPPSRQEWEGQQDAIKRNNAENKSLRLLRKALAGQGIDISTADGLARLTELAGDGGGKGKAGDPAIKRAVERATASLEGKYRSAVAGLAVKAALADAGFSGRANEFGRVMSMLDMDEMELADDGSVSGIAEQIAGIKNDIPHWFAGDTARRRGAAEVDAGERRSNRTATQTWVQRVDDQLSGKTR